LTLPHESNNTLWIVRPHITMEIVGQLGFLYLAGIWCEILELTLEAKKTFIGTLVVCLVVHNFSRTWHREASAG